MTASKIVAAAASGVGGAGLDIDEVFSTFLYDGNNQDNRDIVNGIDLANEGGMVWTKSRSNSGTNADHSIADTVRGVTKILRSSSTAAQVTENMEMVQFNSNGYRISYDYNVNIPSQTFVSWTFRKAKKFFDVVTFTGDGNEPSAWISHSLGQIPGMIIIKRTDSTSNWFTWHKGLSGRYDSLYLNLTNSSTSLFTFDNTTNGITDTQFRVNFGGSNIENISGATYVAYLFAHNNNDGGFGPDGDQDIIKCGSYSGNGSSTGPVIDLGFEPQWLMIKNASTSRDWLIFDNMRGITTGGNDPFLIANGYAAEENNPRIRLTSTGFQPDEVSSDTNNNGETYIYMAIRRGPLAAPTDATKVFAPIAYTTTDGSWQDRILQSNFTTDLAINGYRNISDGGTHTFVDRLRGYGTILRSHQTSAESDRSGDYHPWPQTGQSVTSNEWSKYNSGNGLDYYNYQWKRAPGYFDVVAMTATSSSSSHTVNHNLTVPPEMVWIKRRDSTSSWTVYHNDGSTERTLYLETTLQGFSNSTLSSVGATSFVVNGGVLNASATYIMYLFASLDGVSKVGSYTGNGSSQNIDCGFSSGARFVLFKRTDTTGSWHFFDTSRGIVSGNDPVLQLNNNQNENSNDDYIDPHSSGFSVASASLSNASGGSYIFYAIA